MKIEIGKTYKGIKAGKFVVIATRIIGGEDYAQVKELMPNGKLGRGEFALPFSALK
jgi:hypothetical protein